MKETTLTNSNDKDAAKAIAEIDAIFAKIARIDERIAKDQQETDRIHAETCKILERLKAR